MPVPAAATVAQPRTPQVEIPVAFEANQGQASGPAQFVARVPGGTTFFFSDLEVAAVLARKGFGRLDRLALKIRFPGASPGARLEAVELLPGTSNYLLGSDSSRWLRGVPAYASLVYHDLFYQTDLRYRGEGGQIKYDLVLRPGAVVDDITLEYEGAQGLRVNAAGQLEILTAWGTLVEEAPRAWQVGPGGYRTPVAARYALGPGNRVGFQVGSYDPAHILIIDPTLRYSTFVGGSNADAAQDVVLDSAGNALVTGSTTSTNFPTSTGAYQETNAGGEDVYVFKLAANGGSLLFSTFIGGAGDEIGYSLDLNSSGNIVVVGATDSTDFPTTSGAYSEQYNGGTTDAFVTTLASDGSTLAFSTFLGGEDEEIAFAVEVAEEKDQPVVTGFTTSEDFPTTSGAVEEDHSGGRDVFVTRVLEDASVLRYSTLAGGTDADAGQALTVDDDGNVLVTGYTFSTDFPTTSGVWDRILNGAQDAFVLRLSPKGTSFRFSTYLGGAGNDSGQGVALDLVNNVVITGKTASADFPTSTGAYDESHNGGEDAFVTKLDVDGEVLQFSTFVGGSSADFGTAVKLDGVNNPIITGLSRSGDFPTSEGALDPSHNGEGDAILLKLAASGKSLMYSTYAGGSSLDEAFGLDLSPAGDAVIVGRTQSSDFITSSGAYDPGYNGTQDAFALRLNGLGTPPAGTVDATVALPSDDAEELNKTGVMDLDNTDLKLVRRSGAQTIGLRFQNITIPPASTILKATLEFTADEDDMETTVLTFHAQDVDAAPTFSVTARDISTRTVTTAFGEWNPVQAWNNIGDAYETPDLSAPVQEVVDRSSWTPGNSLAFIITGTGRRVAVSHEGAMSKGDESLAPRLKVIYGAPCYRLNTSAGPAGSGSVVVDPAPNCREGLYTAGTKVQLTAVPAEGYTLANWGGDASGSASPTTITMDGEKTVTATFKTATCYTLTTSANPEPGGTVVTSPAPNCGGGKFAAGTEVELTAMPAASYAFSYWTGAAPGTTNPTKVTMDADKAVTAHFSQPTCYNLDTSAAPGGSGMVSANPPGNCGPGKYVEGTEVSLTAVPATDHVFLNWSGGATGTANPILVAMDADKTITANFQRETCYSLATAASPASGGSISALPVPTCGGGEYVSGTVVQLTANPAEDHVFTSWTGDLAGSTNPAAITLDGDKSVTAQFEGATCFSLGVDLSPPEAGEVLQDPPADCGGGEYSTGTTVSLTASPGTGYVFDRWSGDLSGDANPASILVDADKLVTAHFLYPNEIYLPLAYRNEP
jgi:hypothetical protein